MPSFDIVCEINMQEVDNAVNQASKEIDTRFDFRGGKSEIQLDKENKKLKIMADDEMKLRSIKQIIESKFARRGIDCRALDYGKEQEAGMGTIRVEVTLKNGLSKEEAKEITKKIKDSKLKVQAQVQDEQVRVSGKSIDDLQAIIALLKGSDLGYPLQYINMRS